VYLSTSAHTSQVAEAKVEQAAAHKLQQIAEQAKMQWAKAATAIQLQQVCICIL
jgi:hypothetical protein